MLNVMTKRLSRILSLLLALSLCTAPAAWALTPQQAYELLAYYYVDELPEGIEQMSSVEEIVAALKDPYTVYMTAEERNSFVSSINDGTLVGIGVAIQVTADGLLITSVLDGSPALRAGLTAGDLIIEADGTPLAGMGDAASALIRGKEGTDVTITVRRENGAVLTYTLTRQLIVIPNTTTEVLEDSWGYILCDTFGDETAQHFYDGLEAYDSQVGSWIVDLRGNPGGTSDAAATSAAYFIGEGILVYFRDGDGNCNFTFAPSGFPKMTEKQVLVLTSPYSASGSELFAAAIRDYGVGTLVGQRTYGKGVAQALMTGDSFPEYFQDGEALKVTVSRFFSPEGTTNDKIGVIPHILVSDDTAAMLATLLSGKQPSRAEGFLRLTVAGVTWYIDLNRAMGEEYRAAFTELLEAVSADSLLERGSGTAEWKSADIAELGRELGLNLNLRTFTDLADSRYAHEIDVLACYQMVLGDGKGNFRPGDPITRGELACMIAGLLRVKAVGEGYFSDVTSGDWYANGVNALYEMGIVTGYGDGTFRPGDPISHQELITILANVGRWLNMDLYGYAGSMTGDEDDGALSHFSSWARPYADLCDAFGLLWEDASEIEPAGDALREEAAALLYRLLTYTNVLPADCRE